MGSILNELEVYNPLDEVLNKPMQVFVKEDAAYKVYTIKDMLRDPSKQQGFFNEYSMAKQAKELNLKNIMHLDKLCFAEDYLALRYPLYDMTLRTYI